MKLSTIISNTIQKGYRIYKALTLGSNTETAPSATVPGIDFNAPKNIKAIFAKTANSNDPVIVGYINKVAISDLSEGEMAIFSTDNESELAIIKLRSNKDIELNGDTDNVTRYTEVKKAYDELRDDFNTFVTDVFNLHVHPGVTSGGASTAVTPTTGQESEGDISNSKVDNVKTN